MNAFNYSLNKTSMFDNTSDAFSGPFFDYQIQRQQPGLHKQSEGILCFYQKTHPAKLHIHPHEHIEAARIAPIQTLMKHTPDQLPPCLWAVNNLFIDFNWLASEHRASPPITLSHTDKIKHLLYPIQSYRSVKRVKQACANIDHVMIADGHHRFEAFMRDPALSILPVLLMPLDQLQVRRFYLWLKLSKPYISSDIVASILPKNRFQPCAPEQADLFLEWRQQQHPFQWISLESQPSIELRDPLAFTELEAHISNVLSLSKDIDSLYHETQDTLIVDQDKLIKIIFKPPCKKMLFQQAFLGEKQPKKSTCFQNKPVTNSTQCLYASITQQSSERATGSYQGSF